MKQRVLSLFLALVMGLSLMSGAAMAAGSPADETKNIDSTYNGNWAVPVNSYLYQDGENLVRVEHDQGWNMINSNTGEVTVMRPEQIIVQTYSPQFRLLDSRIMELELPIWGGFFAGETYNFCVFGQENPSESDSVEVIRVVKYDKQWNRLGQASLYGANTYIPFEAGSLRMDEYGGYLYIHTSHEMYAGSDGLHHQANLTFSVREPDMEITDSFSGVANTSAGYVSHSFNQFILVDQDANIVTLNHGDAYPRGAVLMRYSAKAGSDKFITANGSHWNAVSEEVMLRNWPGSIGDNTTGAQITGLAETSTGYLVAFSDTGKGAATSIGKDVSNIFEAGSLRMDEYGGYLYIHTSHEMYAGSDGLHHQANLTFSVREPDMEITDSFSGVANTSAGYVSHSFNQFILVDQDANIVTLNHGDAYPRGAVLMRYSAKAGSDKFITANGSHWNAVSEEVMLRNWPGSIGDNTTGAQITGLAETSTGYLVAFSDTGKGAATSIGKDVSNIYLAYTAKNNFTESGTTVRPLTDASASSSEYGSQPRLVPTGLDGGYILWDVAEKSDNGYFYNNGTLQYARYNADGTISQIQTVENTPLFNGQPICCDGKVVWYTTDYDDPVFYVLDESGVTAYPTSDSAQEPSDKPGEQTDPSFTDVPDGAWYAQYVEKAVQAGLMEGTGNGRFSPDDTLSISQVIALCVRLHAQYNGNTVPETVDGPWYQGAYQYGLEEGLFNRSQLSSFIANNPASRLQMVAWMDKAVPEGQKQPIHSEVTIPDVAPTDPGGTEIYKWYKAGILEGDSSHRFNGGTSITRAETAAILCRLAGLTPRI